MLEITDADLMDEQHAVPRESSCSYRPSSTWRCSRARTGARDPASGSSSSPASTSSRDTLDPIVVPGLFNGVVNDLYLSRISPRGRVSAGARCASAPRSSEEGVELRGGLADLDVEHMHLDMFMLPSLDSHRHRRVGHAAERSSSTAAC